MKRMRALRILIIIAAFLSAERAAAQSLMNSLSTIAMQRCLAAVETGAPPRYRTLFPGTPAAGVLPQDLFAATVYWLTPDDRIFLTIDARGNCAVGDTRAAEDAQAHENAIRKFNAWGAAEIEAGRYIDTLLEDQKYAYRRTFVSGSWAATPILVTLVSDPSSGLLALIAEKSAIVGDGSFEEEPPSADDEMPSNLLNKVPLAPGSVEPEENL